jgi:hypothetical protein
MFGQNKMKKLLVIFLVTLCSFGAIAQELRLGVSLPPQLINTYEANLDYRLPNSSFSITFKYGKMIDRTSKFSYAMIEDGITDLVSNGDHLALGGRYSQNNSFVGALITHSTYEQEGMGGLIGLNIPRNVKGDMYAVGVEVGKVLTYNRINFLAGFQLNYLLNYNEYLSRFSSPSGVGRFVVFGRKIAPQLLVGISYSLFKEENK